MKHTKGPWRLDPQFECLIRTNGKQIGEFAPYGKLDLQLYLPEREESEANARLASTAPEMLEILLFLKRHIDEGATRIYFEALTDDEDGTTLGDLIDMVLQKAVPGGGV